MFLNTVHRNNVLLNDAINQVYWAAWAKLPAIDEEDGAEAVEWIAMVGAILVLLIMVQRGMRSGGQGIGSTIASTITAIVSSLFKV